MDETKKGENVAGRLSGAADRLLALGTIAKHDFGMAEAQSMRIMLERIMRDLIEVDQTLLRESSGGNPLLLIRKDDSRVWN